MDTVLENIELLNCPVILQSRFIQLHTRECIHNLRLSDVLYCASDNSMTVFYTGSAKTIIVSKSLKYYEQILRKYGFERIHNKHLINLTHVESCCHGEDGSFVKLTNGTEISVSRAMRKNLVAALKQLSVCKDEEDGKF